METTTKNTAELLVKYGYATNMKPITYGLTKLKTYEIFVEGEGWQTVDPYGNQPYSKAQCHALQDIRAMLKD
jgi:hypothetical protein